MTRIWLYKIEGLWEGMWSEDRRCHFLMFTYENKEMIILTFVVYRPKGTDKPQIRNNKRYKKWPFPDREVCRSILSIGLIVLKMLSDSHLRRSVNRLLSSWRSDDDVDVWIRWGLLLSFKLGWLLFHKSFYFWSVWTIIEWGLMKDNVRWWSWWWWCRSYILLQLEWMTWIPSCWF